jgi:hypothetical protein
VWVPEPGHDLIVGLVIVQGKRCIAYAVSGEREPVRRLDLLWGDVANWLGFAEKNRWLSEEENRAVK